MFFSDTEAPRGGKHTLKSTLLREVCLGEIIANLGPHHLLSGCEPTNFRAPQHFLDITGGVSVPLRCVYELLLSTGTAPLRVHRVSEHNDFQLH